MQTDSTQNTIVDKQTDTTSMKPKPPLRYKSILYIPVWRETEKKTQNTFQMTNFIFKSICRDDKNISHNNPAVSELNL